MPPQDNNPIINPESVVMANTIPTPPKNRKYIFIFLAIVLILVIAGIIFTLFKPDKEVVVEQEIIAKEATVLCSSYFGICFENIKDDWKIGQDVFDSFVVYDEGNGSALSILLSNELQFVEEGEGYVSVDILDQLKPVYRSEEEGLFTYITGTKFYDYELIFLIESKNEIGTEAIKGIIGKIKFPVR